MSNEVRIFSTTADWFVNQGWQEGDRYEIAVREGRLVIIRLPPVVVSDEIFAAMERAIQK